VPHFVAICRDRAGSLELRKATRPSHLNYLETLGPAVAVGGPITADRRPVGSIIVLEASDQAAAESIFANDPYFRSGLFESVEIVEWTPVVGSVGRSGR
jgi:uncharacterized protein YciI